ncbi:MAG: OmpA family protein [Alphaproteobacteria bacterium]|nr:OmpA family protein [Alphaproteobacteria bacterium]
MSMKKVLLATVFLAAGSMGAEAADGRWYIGAGAGANWIDNIAGSDTVGTPWDAEFDTGYIIHLNGGFAYDSGWRVELEGAYRDNEGDFDIAVTQSTLFANVLYDFELSEKFDLTLGAGIGGVYVDTDGTGLTGDDWTVGFQGIAGLGLELTDNLEAFLEYRIMYHDSASLVGNIGVGPYGFEDTFINHSATIGLRYFFGTTPAPVVETPPPVVEDVAPKTFIVFFDFNKSNLTAEAQAVVAEASEAFKAGANVVLVVGHTDTVGSAGYNQKLSERRAASVKAEMVRLGVPSDVITTEGRGFSEPLVPTGPGVKEPQNRRAVIELK